MSNGYDQRKWVTRATATKDLEYCRFVDEDFRGISLDTTHNWNVTYLNAGSGSFVDDNACGIYQMLTDNNINDSGILNKNNIRIVDPSLFPLICFRVRIPDIADTNIEMRLGLVDVFDTDHCTFEVDASVGGADMDIMVDAYSGGGQTETVDTGIDLDANWHIYEIYINADGKPYWYLDGVLENEGDDADIDVTEFFQPYAEILTENADVKTMDIDFIKGWQKRA